MTGDRPLENTTDSRSSHTTGERGVTVTLNYILVLSITAVLVSGLLIASGTFVEDQRERVIEDELNVIGNHIAGDIEQVDRMVRASDGTLDRAEINQSFQRTLSGTTYSVQLQPSPGRLVLEANAPEVTVTVPVNTTVQTDIEESFAFGGDTSVQYDPTVDRLVIVND